MAEDLHDEIAPALSTLHFPPEGFFVRLDACSPKDGAHKVPGKISLHSVDEIILRLVTSGRCRAALEDCLDSMKTVELFFLPFDPRMASEREVTGISQYRWHKPWRFATSPEGAQNAIIRRICQQAEHIRQQILADLKSEDENDRIMMAQGMSFDLLYDKDTRTVELVELNPFGVRSPCGSCLFQWIRDREVLYDENEKETVEFRVSY
uniref:Cell division cycle protein 123 n=1 Tax=Colletotrichum fructicola (strain Nara gc5) TaxID=1213859 RepID=L2G5H5_COLFN